LTGDTARSARAATAPTSERILNMNALFGGEGRAES
jgi:hemin uptake protein HemP